MTGEDYVDVLCYLNDVAGIILLEQRISVVPMKASGSLDIIC